MFFFYKWVNQSNSFQFRYKLIDSHGLHSEDHKQVWFYVHKKKSTDEYGVHLIKENRAKRIVDKFYKLKKK